MDSWIDEGGKEGKRERGGLQVRWAEEGEGREGEEKGKKGRKGGREGGRKVVRWINGWMNRRMNGVIWRYLSE